MSLLPRLLVIDDFFGRTVNGRRNEERANLCAQFLLRDVTGDEDEQGAQRIVRPRAETVFCRGQRPACSVVGDTVENDLESVLRLVRDGWAGGAATPWAMVLLDLCFYSGRVTAASDARTTGMPEGRPADDSPDSYFGLRVLEAIHREFPDLPVIILSSKSRDDVSRHFTSMGALGFLARESLASPGLLDEYLHRHGLVCDAAGEIVGGSRSLLLALRTARRLAGQRGSILLGGERGSGKEMLARYIYRSTPPGEKARPFIAVNAGQLTPDLFASELFGIEAGAATGVTAKAGFIVAADGGDLFLDEIKDMPTQVQAGVLRVLQDRLVTPVGGRAARPVDVRFLSASNANLDDLLGQERVRSDLLDRLRDGGTVVLPSLRERTEDIPLLVEHFVREAERTVVGAMRREITPESLAALREHPWPGNVRELRSVVFDAVNSHPDVEFLVPLHLTALRSSTTQQPVPSPAEGVAREHRADSLAVTLRGMRHLRLSAEEPSVWGGRLTDAEGAVADFFASLVRVALVATRRRTPEAPDGMLCPTPAMKLLTGDGMLRTPQAADLVKRLLSVSKSDRERLLAADDLLREAYAWATDKRPRAPKAAAGGPAHHTAASGGPPPAAPSPGERARKTRQDA